MALLSIRDPQIQSQLEMAGWGLAAERETKDGP